MFELHCKNCWWYGDPSELVSKTSSFFDRDFSYCPDCGGTDFEEVEDEEE